MFSKSPSLSNNLFILSILIPLANSLSFNFSSFNRQASSTIDLQGDAFFNKARLDLTKNEVGNSITCSTGRAVYREPLLLWDAATGEITDFTTHFSFVIDSFNKTPFGDGLAFFLSPYPSSIPSNSSGGYLGLYSATHLANETVNATVAVEFDTFKNVWDENDQHVGINVNAIKSNVTLAWNSSIKDGRKANAWVTYNASTHNLSVLLTYMDSPLFNGNSCLSWIIDLRDVLPETVAVGFSAATGRATEIHNLFSWSFISTLQSRSKKRKTTLAVNVIVASTVLMGVLSLLCLTWRRRKSSKQKMNDGEGQSLDCDLSIDEEFQKERGGPKRFPHKELASATNDFSEEGKLGEGGFGSVYRGHLKELKVDVAIKRVSRESKQGRKEYISEVKIISQLRHRNLVQLVGWCHERGEFLLVYEFMPNGSLDSYLYNAQRSLDWPTRHKIAMGLASALLYLHEEWKQCVVHRDVKPSNVMLDSAFNAKLGDFGLARFVDHDRGSQTTILAGTMGYLAPECVMAGKASKESDVYSFGVVALEIACGRRPVEPKEQAGKVTLVEWVWGLYGRREILGAADEKLHDDFNEKQMECLMVVGLWCAHPDHNLRPSMKQAINVLNFHSPLPELPPTMPVPMYYAPPMELCRFTFSSSCVTTSTLSGKSASSSGYVTNSSKASTWSSTAHRGSSKKFDI